MNNYRIRWSDGHDREFEEFHAITENYYNQLVGGPQNRQSFVPGNQSKDVKYAMIVYSKDDVPVACSGVSVSTIAYCSQNKKCVSLHLKYKDERYV